MTNNSQEAYNGILNRPNRDTREELQAVVDKKKSSKLS